MLGLALLSLCAVGWASAAPHDEDLRASVVFNQLAIAQLLDNVSNISRGEAFNHFDVYFWFVFIYYHLYSFVVYFRDYSDGKASLTQCHPHCTCCCSESPLP